MIVELHKSCILRAGIEALKAQDWDLQKVRAERRFLGRVMHIVILEAGYMAWKTEQDQMLSLVRLQ